MLWKRNRKGRHTVLGKWRELKIDMFAEHIKVCSNLGQEPDYGQDFEEY
jgi:hypothetical protein